MNEGGQRAKGWRAWFAALLILAALLAAVLHLGELGNFARLLTGAQPLWLLVALALQASTYFSLALGWRAVLLRADGRRFSMARLVRIALCKLFADQALPAAGMGGNLVVVDQLEAAGAPRGVAVAALLAGLRGFYAAYLGFALVCLLLLWLHGQATALLVGLVTSFVLVALAIPGLALWLRRRGSRPLPRAIERVRPIRQLVETMAKAPAELVNDRRLLAWVTAFNALIFAADILTLQACLQAIGAGAALSTALIAFVLASMAVTLGPLPFGLGSFEVVCTSTLHLLGTGIEAALAGTMLLRLFTLWLPLVPGIVLTRQMIGRRGQPRRP